MRTVTGPISDEEKRARAKSSNARLEMQRQFVAHELATLTRRAMESGVSGQDIGGILRELANVLDPEGAQ